MGAWSRRLAVIVLVLVPATMAPMVLAQGSQEPLAGVGQQVPEFGGAYVDESSGKLFIWLTDTRDPILQQARSAVLGVLGARFSVYETVALSAEYSFLDLVMWQEQATARAGSLPGVVFIDADEQYNKLTIAVEDVSRDGPAVEAEIAKLGVPSAALRLVRSGPIRQLPRSSGLPITLIALATALGLGVTAWAVRYWRRARTVASVPASNSAHGRASSGVKN